jgi:Fe-S-cluster containining protein
MSKNKKNKKIKDDKFIKSIKKFKKKAKIVSDLNSVLQSIYHDIVNLDTTCNPNCAACCKVACPSHNLSEFTNIISDLWPKISKQDKMDIICKSIEYFFKTDYEKWGKEIFLKPCILLDAKNLCRCYERRPLSCRLYGLWPKELYEKRVDKFEKAYAKYDIKREDIPLNKQCPFVKRKDQSIPITQELIDLLYKKVDNIDESMGEFTPLQISQKEHYRTFHDWVLFKVFGAEWLSKLSVLSMAADRATLENQITLIKEAVNNVFKDADVPNIGKKDE